MRIVFMIELKIQIFVVIIIQDTIIIEVIKIVLWLSLQLELNCSLEILNLSKEKIEEFIL
jgi:hypothetical protein